MFNLRTQRRHAWWWDSATAEGTLSWLNTAQDICWSGGLSAGKTPAKWTKLFCFRMSCHAFWVFPNLKPIYQNLRTVSSQPTDLHSCTRGQPCFLAPSVHVCVSSLLAHGESSTSNRKVCPVGLRGLGELTWSSLHKQCSLWSPWWCVRKQRQGIQYHKAPGSVSVSVLWGKREQKKMKARCSGSTPCLATQKSSNAVLLRKLCDFSRHSTMHYFLISPVISSAKQLCKL